MLLLAKGCCKGLRALTVGEGLGAGVGLGLGDGLGFGEGLGLGDGVANATNENFSAHAVVFRYCSNGVPFTVDAFTRLI